jgi:hypothetical protein
MLAGKTPDPPLRFTSPSLKECSMKRLLFVLAVATAFGGARVTWGQWSLPSERLGTANIPGWPLTNPTVWAPSTYIALTDQYGFHTDTDPISTDVGEMLAYGATGSSLLIDSGLGSVQTTGQASCGTAINAFDFVPQVDTLVTALMNVDYDTVDAADGENWSNAALVVTAYEIQNNPEEDPVEQAILYGNLWLFAQGVVDIPPSISGETLGAGAVLDAEVGGSGVDALFLGTGNGWFLNGFVVDQPENEVYEDWIPNDDLDLYFDSTEEVAVPSVQLVAALIFADRIIDEGEIVITTKVWGSATGNVDAEHDLKASAWYEAKADDED